MSRSVLLLFAVMAVLVLIGRRPGTELWVVHLVRRAFRKRWEVRCLDVNRTVIDRRRFWLRRTARRYAEFQAAWGSGSAARLNLPEGLPPLYTAEVVRCG